MLQAILKILAALIILIGVILIFDARLITKKFFGFGDQNDATSGIKILGFLTFILGIVLLYFNH